MDHSQGPGLGRGAAQSQLSCRFLLSPDLLPTLCLGLPLHKWGKMTPECQQWPSVALTTDQGGKGQNADSRGKDISKVSSMNCHPSMGLVTDTTVGGTHPFTCTTTAHSQQISCGTHSPHNTFPKFQWTTHPAEGSPEALWSLLPTGFSTFSAHYCPCKSEHWPQQAPKLLLSQGPLDAGTERCPAKPNLCLQCIFCLVFY